MKDGKKVSSTENTTCRNIENDDFHFHHLVWQLQASLT